ncbi:MAG: undecaprenyldiphospho-muramoylpentapeptide beta-N-acetylglucosaminyltransferase [candidate division Zixibacteria bacterium]|nr:undecaprenyldiphospho-muramoylpentapeptide beta-N-acetylglucosaminyltransferase [candidate division Zixibacteria bacterium]
MTTPGVKLVFAGGGTGGHLYPAIAIADRIRELLIDRMPVEIIFVGTRHGLEYRMRDKLGYPLHLLNIRGLARSLSVRNLLLPFLIVGAVFMTARLLRRFAPDVVVGTGGYVSWPVLKIAALKGIPTVIQEQNSFPGITTRQTAGRAKRIYLGFEQARNHLKTQAKVIVTGNPVRRSVTGGERSEGLSVFGLDPGRKTILVLGGSQGARAINRAVLGSLKKKNISDKYQILWQTGKRDYKDVTASAGNKVSDCSLFPFSERMDLVYAVADLAVARAGALTLAELTACGIPAMLVPYPYAAGDHQRRNAEAFVEQGAAMMIDENDLNQADLIEEAIALMESDRFEQMKQAVAKMTSARRPAVDVIAEDIIALIEESRKGGDRT